MSEVSKNARAKALIFRLGNEIRFLQSGIPEYLIFKLNNKDV
ncbi:30712_t:CDS:1, partial [Gigaspora margarita]